MLYYRVKDEDDQRKIIKKNRVTGFYIAGEILTEREAKKKGYDISRLEAIETSKNNTYWLFGTRFVSDNSKVKIWQGQSETSTPVA